MHDLVIDRRAHARRKVVQPLERRGGAVMRANEVLRQTIEVRRGHTGLHRGREHRHGIRENSPTVGHYVDLTGRFQLNHFGSARTTRSVTSSGDPTAFTAMSGVPFLRYQSMTGAVCSR